jgi:ankyrin
LAMSIQQGTEPIIRLLLEHGADPNVQSPFVFQPSAGPNARPEKSTPLIYAIRTKQTGLVELLLQHGANVDQPDSAGRTPLPCAILDKNVPVVNLLLAKSADPNLKDKAGDTPLSIDLQAAEPAANPYAASQDALLMELQKRANPNIVFPQASGYSLPMPSPPGAVNPPARVRTIPSRNARTSVPGPQQSAPTARTIGPERRSILEALLDHKADVNARDSRGLPPLIQALQIGDPNAIQALLSHGADVQEASEADVTPLLEAANLGDADVVKSLLAKSADLNRKAINGYTPLHVAAAHGDTNVLEILLQLDADPNVQDDDTYTPLHYAAFEGHKPAVEMLLAHGAKLDITSRNGLTPAMAASEIANAQVSPPLYDSMPRITRTEGVFRSLFPALQEVRDFFRQFTKQDAGQ